LAEVLKKQRASLRFFSRFDRETDRRLAEVEAKGGDDGASAWGLHGQAAIANACLAYEVYEKVLDSPRWQALKDAGARPQRLLWAFTGVKDKVFSDTRYVEDLVAPDTVNTMPQATLQAVADHGIVRGNIIRGNYIVAREVFDKLGRLGINMADVAESLERQGIATFVKSWYDLISSVTAQLKIQGAEVMPAGAVRPVGRRRAPVRIFQRPARRSRDADD
jgi:transaldolase